MEPFAPCPYARKADKGRHNICVIVPDTSETPAVLFCDACGMTRHISLQLPQPVDDWSAADIADLARKRA